MARQKNHLKQHLSKFKEAIPNRAKLAYESLFAATEQERSAAQVLLDLLPNETRTTDEKVQWSTDIWLNAPTVEQLALSPAGRQILEMVSDSKSVGDGVQPMDGVSSPEPPAKEAQAASAAMPAVEDDGVNDYLKKLDWPPKSTPQPKAPVAEDAVKPLWVAARPTPETRGDLKPLAPDESFDSNSPIY